MCSEYDLLRARFRIPSTFIVSGVIPSVLLIFIRIRYPKGIIRGFFVRLVYTGCCAILFLAILNHYYQYYSFISRSNNYLRYEIIPYNYVYFGYKAFYNLYLKKEMPFTVIGGDAKIIRHSDKPTLAVVVIGESARAQNFKFSGYHRDTTPYTGSRDDIISLEMTSCGTCTAVSLPCMLSWYTRQDYSYDKGINSSSIADIIQKAGYRTVWIENDGGCKGTCKRVNFNFIEPFDPSNSAYCRNGTCFDEILVNKAKEELKKSVKAKQNTVVFLHLIGSHGPSYYERVPSNFKVFKPSCERSDVEKCTKQEIINAYDNTLVYTDYVLSLLIKELENYSSEFNGTLLYVSDHGESLGEYGLYLHGTPYAIAPDTQKKVPFMIWFSKSFFDGNTLEIKRFQNDLKNEKLSHDHLFYGLMGLLGIGTKDYDPKLDIFRSIRE